jgi:FlaA1/EpsC-like NDP-sugar epimerase
LEPGRDIEIVFTGSRQGEKMHEELFAEHEEPRPTQHQKILVAHGDSQWDSETLARHIQELEALVREGNAAKLRAKLQEVVPEYRPGDFLERGLARRTE